MAKELKLRERFSPLTLLMLVLLCVYSFIFLYMIFWGVMQIFKPADGGIHNFINNPNWFPEIKDLTFNNFKALFEYAENVSWTSSLSSRPNVPLWEVYINSIIYSVGGAFVNVTATCIMAYLAAKYKYWYSKLIYTVVIIVMATPVVGSQASEIEILSKLGLYNTRFGFIVLKASFVGMYFLVLHATFKSIPSAYNEAAMIDGASDMRIFIQVCLPLALNVYFTVFLITFIQFWNDYQMAMLYMTNYPTLSYFLYVAQTNTSAPIRVGTSWVVTSDPPFKMAATFMLVLPIVVIFIAFNKQLMGNLNIGGIKG